MKRNKFIYLYVIQGYYYGQGWEDLTQSENYREAQSDLKCYRANDPDHEHRLIQRREPTEQQPQKFRVFKRTWWIKNAEYPNGLEPGPGYKKYIRGAKFDDEQQVRSFCQYNNANNLPPVNPLSLKFEYESY